MTKIQEDGKLCPPRAGVLGEHGPLRFGLLGCADVAWRSMLPAMTADPDISVVAVASRNVARARRFADRFGCEAMTSYERLLARSDIDAVYVPLPAMLHAEWVEEALLTGKHVLAEKPLTHSHQATSRLFQLAHARGLHLLENFMFLRHTQHTAVASLLADGAIGELRGFESAFTIPPRPADDIRYQPDVGGGALLDIGVYPIRAALHFLGPDLTLAGSVLRSDRRRDVILSGSVLLTTPQGVTAQLTFGMEHSYRAGYTFAGSSGRLMLDRVFTPGASHRPAVRIERQDHHETLTLPASHQFATIAHDFARAVLDGQDLQADREGSLRQAMLVDEIRQHSRFVQVNTP